MDTWCTLCSGYIYILDTGCILCSGYKYIHKILQTLHTVKTNIEIAKILSNLRTNKNCEKCFSTTVFQTKCYF